jgi:c(7)-type cytochrome triheme protein
MRYAKFGSVVVAVALALSPLAASTGFAQAKPPADMTFEGGKDSPGKVTFSHEKHMAGGGKCTACHVKVFKMKKGGTGPLTMDKMKAGEQCGACHTGKPIEGKTAFAVADTANCEKCHKK